MGARGPSTCGVAQGVPWQGAGTGSGVRPEPCELGDWHHSLHLNPAPVPSHFLSSRVIINFSFAHFPLPRIHCFISSCCRAVFIIINLPPPCPNLMFVSAVHCLNGAFLRSPSLLRETACSPLGSVAACTCSPSHLALPWACQTLRSLPSGFTFLLYSLIWVAHIFHRLPWESTRVLRTRRAESVLAARVTSHGPGLSTVTSIVFQVCPCSRPLLCVSEEGKHPPLCFLPWAQGLQASPGCLWITEKQPWKQCGGPVR